MGAWLDKFEQLILNYSRRVITVLFIISATVVIISAVLSAVRYYESFPRLSFEDRFSLPKFEKPVSKTPANTNNTNNTNSEKNKEAQEPKTQENKIEEAHPMPKYKSEISQITEYIYPLYVAFYKWDTSSLANFDGKIQITNVIANNLRPFTKYLYYNEEDSRKKLKLSEQQMDDVVNGLVEYIKNFSNYYIRKFNINSNIDEIRPRNNEEFERILRNPYKKYLDEVRDNYDSLVADVYLTRDFAEEMKIELKSIILVAGIATSVMVTLILLLLIFKAENSLRRQANSFENTSKKE